MLIEFRRLPASTLAVLLIAGCGDTHSPVVRGGRTEANPSDTAPPPVGDHFQSPSTEEQAVASGGSEVDLGAVRLTAPQDWIRNQPRIDFIRAEFVLPKSEGDDVDGRLTVSVAGGSLQDNIDRWRQQFSGKPEKEAKDQIKVAEMEVTLVDFSGTYHDQRGPFAPAEERTGYRMLGAIFDLEGQLHFIKCYGPAKTMEARAGEFRSFVQSLQLAEPNP